MKTNIVYGLVLDTQKDLYTCLNEKAKDHPSLARLCALPVAVLEEGLRWLELIAVIEYAAVAVINVLGALFDERCSLKAAIKSTDDIFCVIGAIPSKVLLLPVRISFQTIAILIDPIRVTAMKEWKSTYGLGYQNMFPDCGKRASDLSLVERVQKHVLIPKQA